MRVERIDDYIYVRAEGETWVRPIEAWGNLRELRQWVTGIAGESISKATIIDFLNPISLDIADKAAVITSSPIQASPNYSDVVIDSAEGIPAQG